MRILPLCFIFLFLAACGDAEGDAKPEGSLVSTEFAEQNLVMIRDACHGYFEKNGRPPEHMGEIVGFGVTLESLSNDDYSDEGYEFSLLEYDLDSNLTSGWFFASSKGSSSANRVRMNGVTGEFDYVPNGQRWQPAKEDMPGIKD